ncbi:MAG: DNA alkylation repair protein [Solobacterium sp.]|nr:DNA alkylation repair protein [Solobacterium sp.]
MNIHEEIRKRVLEKKDEEYKAFQIKLIPNMNPKGMIGVRTNELKKLAKEMKDRENNSSFLIALPHQYFEENQLHAFILMEEKNYEKCIESVNAFLPYIDNWATCDQLSPKVFGKEKKKLLKEINRWLKSKHTYTKRFGIKMLMQYYLDEDFDIAYVKKVVSIKSEEYYVKMMVAWYLATALAKQYETILPFLKERKLDTWTHNKAIQKAIESRRLSSTQKEELRKLKIREKI